MLVPAYYAVKVAGKIPWDPGHEIAHESEQTQGLTADGPLACVWIQ